MIKTVTKHELKCDDLDKSGLTVSFTGRELAALYSALINAPNYPTIARFHYCKDCRDVVMPTIKKLRAEFEKAGLIATFEKRVRVK